VYSFKILQNLLYSPLLPLLLKLIIIIINWDFHSFIICDLNEVDTQLLELKNNLNSNIIEYKAFLGKYADLIMQETEEKRFAEEYPLFGDDKKIKLLERKADENLSEASKLLLEIRKIEKEIKKLDPKFNSLVNKLFGELDNGI
jgi:hypothetical protein